MNFISLNDSNWKLAWYNGEEWYIRNDHKNKRLLGFIGAKVPSCVQEDLIEEGIIKDIYKDDNTLNYEWVSQRNWLYKRFIKFDKDFLENRVRLLFKGVDYSCKVFFNGILLGNHEGMFTPFEFDITSLINFDEENILAVAIDEAPREYCQIGYTSKVSTIKARVNYWWDFAQRVIPLGIWDEAYIIVDEYISVENVRLLTKLNEELTIGNLYSEVEIFSNRYTKAIIKYEIDFNGEIHNAGQLNFNLAEGKNLINIFEKITGVKLWWPNGYGDQNLYTIKISIYEENKVIYNYEDRFGFKKVERSVNPGFSDEVNYLFKVNHREIFIKGWNFVPIDLMYGGEKERKYETLVHLLKNANVNLLRIWGGGLIEKEILYKLCDENGIMIWQEFNQSSSGIDNKTPIDEEFIQAFCQYAIEVVKKRRNHVSLTILCGGNELADENGPLKGNDPLLYMLNEIVLSYGNDQIYLPTSPYGEKFGFDLKTLKEDEFSEYADVHGPWIYQGLKDHYDLYNLNRCAFHSEFGVEGCLKYETLKKFLSPEKMWPPTRENRIWSHHGLWFLNFDKMVETFGMLLNIKEYAKVSHYIQAEGLRYAIESNRRRALSLSGTLPWQFNEPYPNAVGTASVDYYAYPKMAYYYVKDAYAKLNLSLKYNGQTFNEVLQIEIWVNSSLDEKITFNGKLEIYNLKGDLLFFKDYEINIDKLETGKFISKEIFSIKEEIIIVRLKNSLYEDFKDYIFINGKNLEPIRKVKSTSLNIAKHHGLILIENVGNIAALFVSADKAAYKNYVTLLPRENFKIELIYKSEIDDAKINYFNEGENDE